jgi:hypothetical protein
VSDSDLIAAVARDSASELETIQREKLSARELAVGDSTSEHALATDGPGDDARAADANATALSTGAAVVVPVSTAPASLPPPAEEPVAVGPSPACPQCEAPMSWVEEHLRFYCKSCRMYF